jgi:predicted dehydrogenase
MHARQAMLAADAGKHILIEKPLAMTSEEGQRVLEYCESKGVRIAAGLMMRFGAYVQVMKKAIAEGKIGRPVSGYSQFTCWYPDMPGVWRQSKKAGGGGAMMDMGVHIIDLMQYVLGSKVSQVAAFHDTLSFHYEVEDSSTVALRMENGAHCVVQTNFNIPDQAAKWRLEFFGDQGRLMGENVVGQVDGGTLDALFLGPQGGYDAIQNVKDAEGEHIDAAFGNLYQREIESFCNSLLTGAPLEVPGSDAVQVQRVLEAAYLSNDTGKIIAL